MSPFETEIVDTGIEEAAASLAKVCQDTTPAPDVLVNSNAAKQPGLNTGQFERIGETLKAAESYIRANWATFPGKRGYRDRRDKQPKAGWPWKKDKLTWADAPKYFGNDQHNVLVALGERSGNLTDIDLDWSEAAAAADWIFNDLPSFGRSGKPRSHRLAVCDNIKNRKYHLPQSLAGHPKTVQQQDHQMCIAEIRCSGAYTVFPGSEHQTGQTIEWTNPNVDNMTSIPSTGPEVLHKKMGLLSFAAFCMRFFPAVGTRCDFMMAAAGALAYAGYDATTIQQTVQCIGAFNRDEGENGSWHIAADSVSGKIAEGKDVTGLPTLIKILGFGDDVLKWCHELLGSARDNLALPLTIQTVLPQNIVPSSTVCSVAASPVVPKDNHMGRARIFRTKMRPNLRHYRDDYYDHEAGHYTVVDDGTIKAELYSFLDTCGKQVLHKSQPKVIPFEPNKVSVSETGEALKAVGHVLPTVEQPYWLDGRPGPNPGDLICFPNGILNLSSNMFMPTDPMLFTPHGVGFDYDPNAPAPVNWLKFLDEVFAGEQDQIDALQEMFGYCVSSDVSQEKVFMLLGEKRSGKDTIRHTLQSLLSPTAICGPTLDSMSSNFGMSQLIGKQLAVVGDMRLGAKCDKDLLAEHVLKLSGRGLFTIDRKYKSHWTGQLLCKLLLISNEMPKLKDTSGALASRMIIYQTRGSFYGREDRHLFRDKIRPELPGILLWSLDGLQRMRGRGPIAEPACSIEARQQLAREGSPVLAFVQECLTLDPTALIEKNMLYAAYVDFAQHNGLLPTSKSWFFRDLETATAGKVKAERVRKDGDNVHNIVGARLREPAKAVGQATEDVGEPSESDIWLDGMIKKRRAAGRKRSGLAVPLHRAFTPGACGFEPTAFGSPWLNAPALKFAATPSTPFPHCSSNHLA
jgi:P4 family phage/plasmid primase-like protien